MTTQFNLKSRTVSTTKGTNGGLSISSLIADLLVPDRQDIGQKLVTLASEAQKIGDLAIAQSLLRTMFDLQLTNETVTCADDKAQVTDILTVEVIALSKLGNGSVSPEFTPVDYSDCTIADLDKSVVNRMGEIAKLGNGSELMMQYMAGNKDVKLAKIAEIDRKLHDFAQAELAKSAKDGTIYLLRVCDSTVKNDTGSVDWAYNSTVIGLPNLDAVKTFIQEKATAHSVPMMEFPKDSFVTMGYPEITQTTVTSLKPSQISDKFKSMRSAIVMSTDYANETQRTAAVDAIKTAKDDCIRYLGSIA